jgi:hypothetical protein
VVKSTERGKNAPDQNLQIPGPMHAISPQTDATQHFAIRGQVGAASFAPWITRHAARLGLCGPPDLLDAMALGCSLGPQEVWVDQIDRLPGNAVSCDEFSSPSA